MSVFPQKNGTERHSPVSSNREFALGTESTTRPTGLRVLPIRMKYIGLTVNKGFATSFFDLDRRMGSDAFETGTQKGSAT